MKVVNTQPFALVYSVLEHAHLGYVLEPHVVQINSLGHYTLSHQKLFSANFDYYQKGLDDTDRKAVRVLEEIEQEKLVRRYYKKGPVRPAEFFKKFFTEELFKKQIRPFMEKKLAEVIPLLPGKEVFLMGKDGNPASRRVQLAGEKPNILFHFRRDGEGTNYFPTIKCGADKVEFRGKGGIILVNEPAVFINDGILYQFDKQVDGNKLRPFLQKKFIHIPRRSEPTYFEKFVVPLIERFDVFAIGFEIRPESLRASARLTIDTAWGDEIYLNLQFDYDEHLFPYHSTKKVSVFLEKQQEEYIFHRIRRNRDWEEKQRIFLESLGLELFQGSAFRISRESASAEYNVIDWLNQHQEVLRERGFTIAQNSASRYFIGPRSLEITTTEDGDWFDVMARVRFGEYEIPFIRLRRYILDGKREFQLPNNEIAIIPEEWFTRFSELIDVSEATDSIRLRRHHWKLLEKLPGDHQERLKKFHDASLWQMEVPAEVTAAFQGRLRPYQLDGFRWFYFLKNNGFGGCLADDMGLGKTIQALALFAQEKELCREEEDIQLEIPVDAEPLMQSDRQQISLFDAPAVISRKTVRVKKQKHPVNLVVLPTSLVYNWLSEAKKFVPNLRVYVHTGTNRVKDVNLFLQHDLIISTYGVVRLDIDFLKNIPFHYVLLDESQAIKNPASLTAKTICQLNARHRLVLTGTPVENTINDLWSQMNFINPGLLGSYNYFQKRFVVPIEKEGNEECRQRLHELISPFILRRTKKQVAGDLPDKYEQVHYCEMTPEQEKVYQETKSLFRNQIMKSIHENGLQKSRLQILKGLILLRQIANHPKLADPTFLGESGKFVEIIQMLDTALEEGHKVLLFSQFVKHLALFRKHLDERKITYAYLDGSTAAKDRAREVDRFNEDESIQVFLISLKAGGTGLNLTTADYVFLADPWWNPAVERQAIDRAHRIGQTQKVFSYKFITKDSVEEKIITLQNKKLELAGGLIDTDDYVLRNLNLVELEDILT